MLSEKSFDLNISYVLNKIKEYSVFSSNDRTIHYVLDLLPMNNKSIYAQDECDILNILQENKIIKIINRQINTALKIIIELEILQPEFDSILLTYNKLKSFIFPKTNFNSKLGLKYYKKDDEQNLTFPKYYLTHILEDFKITLKYLLNSDTLKQTNYKYISNILDSLITLIKDTLDSKQSENINNANTTNTISNKNLINKSIQENLFSKSPLPITGEIKIIGLDEGLKALRIKNIDDSRPKFPFKIPAGTQWHNVIIKFLDDENVEIHVKRLTHNTNYKEMGMTGRGKTPNPNEQWNFLKVLSNYYGEITIRDPEAKDKYKKQKQELTETLRNYFSIDYDPFYPYQSGHEKSGNSYKIKLLLIPPPQPKNITEPTINEDPLGIHEYLNDNYYR